MTMANNMVLCIIIIFPFIVAAEQIPHKIWAYTPSLIDLTSLDILSLNNIKNYANQSNWQFQLLTNQNYTKKVSNSEEFSKIIAASYLDPQIVKRDLLKLTILQEYGGVWLDLSIIVIDDFSWLSTLKNQKYVNNRIDDPQAVLFYESQWFQEIHKRTELKQQELVVIPSYHTWFVAACKGSEFIKDWKKIFTYYVVKQYTEVEQALKQQGLIVVQYLTDHAQFMMWSCRLTVQLKQIQLDRQFGSKQSTRHLAINVYRLSGIQSAQSALFPTVQSNNFAHLTAKYFSEVKASSFGHEFKYLFRIEEKIYHQLLSLVDEKYPKIQYYQQIMKISCDDGKQIPYKYIVKDSIIDLYLLKYSQEEQGKIEVYDDEYVHHHCGANYFKVYYEFIAGYLIPLAFFVIYIFIARKAILIFRPHWGQRQKSLVS